MFPASVDVRDRVTAVAHGLAAATVLDAAECELRAVFPLIVSGALIVVFNAIFPLMVPAGVAKVVRFVLVRVGE